MNLDKMCGSDENFWHDSSRNDVLWAFNISGIHAWKEWSSARKHQCKFEDERLVGNVWRAAYVQVVDNWLYRWWWITTPLEFKQVNYYSALAYIWRQVPRHTELLDSQILSKQGYQAVYQGIGLEREYAFWSFKITLTNTQQQEVCHCFYMIICSLSLSTCSCGTSAVDDWRMLILDLWTYAFVHWFTPSADVYHYIESP